MKKLFTDFYIILIIKLTNMQIIIPVIVGIIKEKIVHLLLPVSFFIVSNVVKHGKCKDENSIVQMAVVVVHPLSINKSLRLLKLSISVIYPNDI